MRSSQTGKLPPGKPADTFKNLEQATVEGHCSYLLFPVSDSGDGMTRLQLGKLFQAFTQADVSTSKKYGGTGLGLALSQKCCQKMGRVLTVMSEFGQGSTFIVKLPAEAPIANSDPMPAT
jgi:signal transduction histidine kinase